MDRNSFLGNKGIESPADFFEGLDDQGRDKLNRLMFGDIRNNDKTFAEHFEGFIKLVPNWGINKQNNEQGVSKKRRVDTQCEETVHLFWEQLSEDKWASLLVLRTQNSGLCYLHAPVVLEHYLIAISTNCGVYSSIDIGLYESDLLSGESLVEFLVKNRGGNSQKTLKDICKLQEHQTKRYAIPDKDELPEAYAQTCEKVFMRVSNEPALVSVFTVFPDFKDATKVSFVGLPNFGDSDEKHSMVLIGARKSTSGDYFFLLQNWWDTKYFVEVSGDCMYHCGALITFVNVPISRRVDLVTYMASYAETCVDTAETYYECL